MRRPLLSAFAALTTLAALAQPPFGNEWINYDARYWSIWVGSNGLLSNRGLYTIDSTTLANAGFPLGSVNAQEIQVFGLEQQIPIFFPGDSDGVFNAADRIEFFVDPNNAKLDAELWDDPAHVNNPYYSLISDSVQYFITWAAAAETKRVIPVGPGNWQSATNVHYHVWSESIWQNPVIYRKGAHHSIGPSTSFVGDGEGYFHSDWTNDANGSNDGPWDITVPVPYAMYEGSAPPSEWTVVIASTNSPGNQSTQDHHLKLKGGYVGVPQVDSIWSAERTLRFDFQVPFPVFVTGNQQGLAATNANFNIVHDLSPPLPADYPDKQALSYIRILYPRYTQNGFENNGANINMWLENQPTYKLRVPVGYEPIAYAFSGDTIRRVTFSPDGGAWSAMIPYDQQSNRTRVFMTNPLTVVTPVTQAFQVNGTGYFNDYGAVNVDSAMVIVTHPQLMNGALQYAQYRENNAYNTYNTLVCDVKELYQQFGGGIPKHPIAIRRLMDYLLEQFDTKPQALFLIGKSVQAARLGGGDQTGYRSQQAADSVSRKMCLVPSFGYPPSDKLFTVGLGGSAWEEIPVGRLSAQTNQQVLDYLDKVQQFEAQPAAAWMKNILHFRGGLNDNDFILFDNALEEYRLIAEDTCFMGNVTKFIKNPDFIISQAAADSVFDLVSEGVTLMTFFAHAYGGGFDISIDQPNNYPWNGKFPMIIGNSCYTGNIHQVTSGSSSEQFVLPTDAGAIAFIASIDLGVSGPLFTMTRDFYRSFSQANYGKSIGRHMQYLDSAVFYQYPPDDILYWSNAQQFTLHGDPTLILNSPLDADLDITDADLRILPDPVTADVDSFQVNATLRNLGNGCNCPQFPVTLVRQMVEEGIYQEPAIQQHTMDAWQDTVTFTLPVSADSGGVGQNNITVSLDLPEPGVVTEIVEQSNNEAQTSFLLTSGDLLPVDPYNFAITPDPAPLLQASTGDPFAPLRNYVFQIDTTDTYDSPMMQQGAVQAPGGVVAWQPPSIYSLNNTQDSLVYYWRCSVDSAGNDGFDWHEFSFQYIPGRKGWGQAHHMQFKPGLYNNGFNNIDHDRPGRDFDYYTGLRNISCETRKNNLSIAKWKKDLVVMEGGGCTSNPALHLAVVDPYDFVEWKTWWQGTGQFLNAENDDSNGCQLWYRAQKVYQFRQTYNADGIAQLPALANALSDSIPDGHYLLVYTYGSLQRAVIDSLAPQLIDVLHDLGADSLYSGAVQEGDAYIFFTQKGNNTYTQEHWSSDVNETISMTAFLPVTGNSGTMVAPRSAEFKAWNSLHWEIDPNIATDSARIVVNVIDDQQDEQYAFTVLPAATTDSIWLDTMGIEMLEDKQLHLLGAYDSELIGTPKPAQTKRWQIVGSPAPECAIDPPLGFFVDADSLFEGQTGRVMVAVHNISEAAMDSLLISARLIGADNQDSLVHYKRNAPLPVNGVVLDTIAFNLAGFVGGNTLVIEANPEDTATGVYDQREQYHFNNIAVLRFETLRDRENPVLDVTFDGVHILDGDIVSGKPEIVLTLDDENQTLLFDDITDTVQFKVFVRYPSSDSLKRVFFRDGYGNEVMRFEPTDGPENVCRVFWNPDLVQDGEYTMIVQASDISRNASGQHDLTVRFEVVNKPTITEVLNYPNPFTTSTRFVFTLTGREVPTGLRIRIMTVSGRVVREIMLDEIGPIHVGRNITEYAWDGRDEFGDRLGAGVYLYHVVTQLNGQDIEYKETSAGGYFTKGFGKMYKLQ